MSLTIFRAIFFSEPVCWTLCVHCVIHIHSATLGSRLIMPEVAQRPRVGTGLPPVFPPAQGGQHREYATDEERRKSFEGRQTPGVFTPTEFAAAGFYLPEQQVQPDQKKVVVGCWYCGVVLDEWEDGDDLLEQHLLHSKATGHAREGSCCWALYLKDRKRWEAGKRVRPRRESSTKEVCRGFSCSSRRSSGQSGSATEDVNPAVGATSSPSGAVPAPLPRKKAKVPPPPPPKPTTVPPPPPPQPTTVPPPPPPKPTTSLQTARPLLDFAVQYPNSAPASSADCLPEDVVVLVE